MLLAPRLVQVPFDAPAPTRGVQDFMCEYAQVRRVRESSHMDFVPGEIGVSVNGVVVRPVVWDCLCVVDNHHEARRHAVGVDLFKECGFKRRIGFYSWRHKHWHTASSHGVRIDAAVIGATVSSRGTASCHDPRDKKTNSKAESQFHSRWHPFVFDHGHILNKIRMGGQVE